MRVLTTSSGCSVKVEMQPDVAPLRKVTIVFGERLRWLNGDDGDGDGDDDDDDAADGGANGAM